MFMTNLIILLRQMPVEIYEYFEEDDYYWYLTSNDGWFNIKNKVKDYCLEVAGGATNDTAAIQVYTCNNTDAQKWTITGVD